MISMKRKALLAILCVFLPAIAVSAFFVHKNRGARIEPAAQVRLVDLLANPKARPEAGPFLAVCRETLANYRKIIVLFADEKSLPPQERNQVNRIGHIIYYENQAKLSLLNQALEIVVASPHDSRFAVLEELLAWIESGNDLYDADRLAFKENLLVLRKAIAAMQTLSARRSSRSSASRKAV